MCIGREQCAIQIEFMFENHATVQAAADEKIRNLFDRLLESTVSGSKLRDFFDRALQMKTGGAERSGQEGSDVDDRLRCFFDRAVKMQSTLGENVGKNTEQERILNSESCLHELNRTHHVHPMAVYLSSMMALYKRELELSK